MFRILPSIYDRIFLAEIVNGQRPRKFFCNYSKHHCRFWQALKYILLKKHYFGLFLLHKKIPELHQWQNKSSLEGSIHPRGSKPGQSQHFRKWKFLFSVIIINFGQILAPYDNSNLDPWSTMHRVVEMSNINRPNCYTDNCDYLEKKYVFTDRDSLRTLHLLNSWIILLA